MGPVFESYSRVREFVVFVEQLSSVSGDLVKRVINTYFTVI